jgi:cephalosporin hydroxylase
LTDTFQLDKQSNIRRLGDDASLRRRSLEWIAAASRHNYSHHFTWMGLPIIQFPQDIMALQEIIWRTKPDLIVETGVARGGSLVFYATMLQLLGTDGIVCGIDIDIRPYNRQAVERHPLAHRIRLIEGSSTDASVARQVAELASERRRVMVVLDSNHTHEHVLRELEVYSPLVTRGCYLVVLDTIIEDLPPGYFADRSWDVGDNPKTAVREFLQHDARFEIDREIESKLLITVAPEGYLRCVAD